MLATYYSYNLIFLDEYKYMKTNNTIQLLSIAINSRTVNIGYNHLSRYFLCSY